MRMEEEHEAATVAGLVSEIAGRIPHPGEIIDKTADCVSKSWPQRTARIERLRISEATPTPDQVQA